MRIPHYLTRNASGLFSFRLRVPRDIAPLLGVRLIKRTLRTDHLPTARLRALALAAGYARAIDELRRTGMTKKLTLEEALESIAANGVRPYTITMPGGITIQADDAADHARAMEGLEALGRIAIPATPPAAAPAAAPVQVAEPITLEKARDAWLANVKASTIPKTYSIKKTAINDLVAFLGPSRMLHTVGRPDLAKWFQHMRQAGIATPTLTNKQSYIGGKRGFFAWAMRSGHYPAGDNPGEGHVSYGSREKRHRRKLGFRAFTSDQVATLFQPNAIAAMSFPARWAAVLGLYTGARAGEVGQLSILDVLQVDGIWCFRITDEGEGQRLKTDVSNRICPVHPHLLELGLLEWVQAHREAGQWRLFPNANPKAKNGAGNWISKAFGAHLHRHDGDWPEGKRGFHSLRKTAIQALQTHAVASEMRAQLVGHELEDEHHAVYSREFSPAEKLNGVKATGFQSPGLGVLDYGLDLDGLRGLLDPARAHQTAPRRGRRPAGDLR